MGKDAASLAASPTPAEQGSQPLRPTTVLGQCLVNGISTVMVDNKTRTCISSSMIVIKEDSHTKVK